ncbi:uncharacterized protein O3C94_001873 [Discoglossus pictus]
MDDIKKIESWCTGGMQVNHPDYDGRTPLHVAVCANLPEMVTFLLQKGANTELRDKHGNRPIDDAKRLGLMNIENILLLYTASDGKKEDVPSA